MVSDFLYKVKGEIVIQKARTPQRTKTAFIF